MILAVSAEQDRFFDKHPVGRIMNRLTMDMATIDLYLYMKAWFSACRRIQGRYRDSGKIGNHCFVIGPIIM